VPLFPDSYDVKTQEGDVGIVIEKLRIEFEIEHNLTKHPNQCLIKITNLNEATRSAFKQSPLQLTLEAGYGDDLAVIFTGDVTYALSALEGSSWVTSIQCADGGRLFRHGRVNKSYSPGTTKGIVIEDLLKDAGKQFDLPDVITNSQVYKDILSGGLAVFGTHKEVVNNLVKPGGFTYSIQDGQPMFLREDDAVGAIYEIGQKTGMIGSPEFGKPDRKGRSPDVTIRTLLYPEIRPGHPVRITSRDLNGMFKVKKVKHRGDNLEGDWVTEVEVMTRPDDPKKRRR
jgi:hypothetical protein